MHGGIKGVTSREEREHGAHSLLVYAPRWTSWLDGSLLWALSCVL